MRTLGLATDLLALEGLSRIETFVDHVVLRTPEEPDYWSGNLLIRLGPPRPPDEEMALFRHHFPQAHHVAIAWDVSDLDPDPVRAAWEPLSFDIEVSDVLARTGAPPPAEPPSGYLLRELGSEADWDDAFALGLEIGRESGFAPDPYGPFLRRRLDGRRAQAAAGLLRWWGAFEGDRLAAAMGVVQAPGLARYQAVETAPAHRRRGLCAALLAHSAQVAVDRDPAARLVIVAQAEGAPGRLYRRAGFQLAERIVSVLRRPEGSRSRS